MKFRTFALAVLATSSASFAFAATSLPQTLPSGIAGIVTYMESRLPGEVTAIERDASGDKGAHYHVDMRFAGDTLIRLDLDAVTLEIAPHYPAPATRQSLTLRDAVALISSHVPGYIVSAQLDSFADVRPHYHVDVQLLQGGTAQLKVDALTGQIAWRALPVANG